MCAGGAPSISSVSAASGAVSAASGAPSTGPPAAETLQLPQCTGSHSQGECVWRLKIKDSFTFYFFKSHLKPYFHDNGSVKNFTITHAEVRGCVSSPLVTQPFTPASSPDRSHSQRQASTSTSSPEGAAPASPSGTPLPGWPGLQTPEETPALHP